MYNKSSDRHFAWVSRSAFVGAAILGLGLAGGCGGNGSQMLMGLTSLDIALRALSPRSLDVIVIDDDTVSQANLGRQPFYPCDIGRSKAHTLTERVNLAHGLAWTAVHGRAPERIPERCYDLVITCVDSIAARRAMHSAFTKGEIAARYCDLYWRRTCRTGRSATPRCPPAGWPCG